MLSRWLIANWLSGYYHAKRNNSIIDLESFENNVNKLNNYCYDEKNFKVPIMEAIERILGSSVQYISPCLQTRARRHRAQAQGLAVPLRPLARLAQDEQS